MKTRKFPKNGKFWVWMTYSISTVTFIFLMINLSPPGVSCQSYSGNGNPQQQRPHQQQFGQQNQQFLTSRTTTRRPLIRPSLLDWSSGGAVKKNDEHDTIGAGTSESYTYYDGVTRDQIIQDQDQDDNLDQQDPDDIEEITPTIETKLARNFGNRIRGLNSGNNVNQISSNGGNNGGNTLRVSRPTSSVISYQPNNYNRIVKRRKKPGNNSTSTTEPPSININTNYLPQQPEFFNPSTHAPPPQEHTFPIPSQYPFAFHHPQNFSKKPYIKPSPELDDSSQVDIEVEEPSQVPVNKQNGQNNNDANPPQGFRSKLVKVHLGKIIPNDEVNQRISSISSEVIQPSRSRVNNFQYNHNPSSVSVSNGVYKFNYDDPSGQYTSRVAHREQYGVSKVTFDHGASSRVYEPSKNTDESFDDDLHLSFEGQDQDTPTTYAPKYFEADETTVPPPTAAQPSFNLQGSEEQIVRDENIDGVVGGTQFPPIYRDYFGSIGGENGINNRKRLPPRPRSGQAEEIASFLNSGSNEELGGESGDSLRNNIVKKDGITRSQGATVVTVTHDFPKTLEVIETTNSTTPTNNQVNNTLKQLIIKESPSAESQDKPSDLNNTTNLVQPTTAAAAASDNQNYFKNSNTTSGPGTGNINENTISVMVSSTNPTPSLPNLGHFNIENEKNKSIAGGSSLENDESFQESHTNSHTDSDINPTASTGGNSSLSTNLKTSKSIFATRVVNPGYSSSSYSYSSASEYHIFSPGANNSSTTSSNEGGEDFEDFHHSDHDRDFPASNAPIQKGTNNFGILKEPAGGTGSGTTVTFWDGLGPNTSSNSSNMTTSSTSVPKVPKDQDLEKSQSSSSRDPEKGRVPPPGSGIRYSTSPIPYIPSPTSSEESYAQVPNISTTERDSNNFISTSSEENLSESEEKLREKDIAFFIQVLLDMEGRIFCSKVPDFKEMISTLYSGMNVQSEQIILYTKPECFQEVPLGPLKFFRNELNKRLDLAGRSNSSNNSNSNDHQNQNVGSYTPEVDATQVVLFYLNNQNGSYDQFLTKSFVDLWNTSKVVSGGSMFFNKIRDVKMVSSSLNSPDHKPHNENSAIIAAITIASIAAVSLFILAVLLLIMRHRQSKTKFAKRCTPVSLDDYSLDNISVFNSFRRKQRIRLSKRSYTNAAFDDPNAPSRSLNAHGLTTFMGELNGGNKSKVDEEFRDLPSQTPTLDDIPHGAETKNRYANVIPMPDTRVLLTFQEDQPNSDYINANYVRGLMSSDKAYIITQAPLDETIVDFWRMVWEQQIRVIFMLTDFAEAGIPKCAQYYPRSETIDCSQLHGDYQITLEKRDISDNCIISYLVIKDMERSLRRDVIHLWYNGWPEKGVPINPKMTVDFLMKSRKFTKEPSPIIVHCSPGTGRSGTIVACDIAMREFDQNKSIDIPRIVSRVRQDRAGSVQTKEQYLHIYQVIGNYASKISATIQSESE